MKKTILAGLLSCLAAMQFLTPAHTQGPNRLASNPNELTAITAVGKTLHPYVDEAGVLVRAKVINTFLRVFNDPTDVKWNLSDNRYLVTFKNNGQVCRALFNVNGNFLYSMKYGTQEALPRDVYRLLKSTYIDYTISSVTEVNTPEAQAWIVNLEDKDNLVIARVADGDLHELHNYKTHF